MTFSSEQLQLLLGVGATIVTSNFGFFAMLVWKLFTRLNMIDSLRSDLDCAWQEIRKLKGETK